MRRNRPYSELEIERLEAKFKKVISSENMNPNMEAFVFNQLLGRNYEAAPDTSGADKFFIDGFITDEMSDEFNVIAYEFLKNHFPDLKEYYSVAWYNNSDCCQTDPYTAMQRKILNLIYNAAKSGVQDAKDLLCYLYKVYYKKEYNQLKRFSSITPNEISSIAESAFTEESHQAVGRILGMSNFMGIHLDVECSFLYSYLKDRHITTEEFENPDEFEPEAKLFQECLEQIEIWLDEQRRHNIELLKQDKKINSPSNVRLMEEFIALALEYEGYSADYIQKCNTYYQDYSYMLAKTYSIMKSIPKVKDITFAQVEEFALVLEIIEAIVTVSDNIDDSFAEICGLEDYREEYTDRIMFHPEDIQHRTPTAIQGEKKSERAINVAPVDNPQVGENDYLSIISDLRSRLAEKDRLIKELRSQYETDKREKNNLLSLLEQFKGEHDEVIALRNAMFELSEDSFEPGNQSIDEMKAAIANKKIIIVGGNENWIKKIKQLFPEWQFISANVSGGFSVNSVCNADKVYFFTDTLGHSNYYRYIQVVRECQVPFGYIHGVNIEGNIQHIYNDICNVE